MPRGAGLGAANYSRLVRRRAGILQVGVPNSYEWTEVELGVAGLARELEGLRIVHVSDLHFRGKWALCYERMIEEINAARADLILITGDFNEKKLDARPAMPFIKRFVEALKARAGKYGILGNHDVGLRGRGDRSGPPPLPSPGVPEEGVREEGHPIGIRGDGEIREDASGGDAVRLPTREVRGEGERPGRDAGGLGLEGMVAREEMTKFLSSLGVEMMDGRREVVPGMGVEVIGLEGGDRLDLDVAWLAGLPRRDPKLLRIVLSHYPDHLRRTALEADLFLAGHTHGGQICLPFGVPIITHDRLGRRMCKGVHRVGRTWLVVSRGVGFATIAMRMFCPPEIIEIRLRGVD